MERRYRVRLDELLADAEIRPGLLRGLLPRLETFLDPFVESLGCPEQRTNAHLYVSGLLSDLKSKDAESIAYLFDRERQGLQKFIGQADRVEECLKRAKGEAGLADDQVRTWEGWHHHQCLSLLATWFLEEEARRGKNTDTGPGGACAALADRGSARAGVESPHLHPDAPHGGPQTQTERRGPTLPLAAA